MKTKKPIAAKNKLCHTRSNGAIFNKALRHILSKIQKSDAETICEQLYNIDKEAIKDCKYGL